MVKEQSAASVKDAISAKGRTISMQVRWLVYLVRFYISADKERISPGCATVQTFLIFT